MQASGGNDEVGIKRWWRESQSQWDLTRFSKDRRRGSGKLCKNMLRDNDCILKPRNNTRAQKGEETPPGRSLGNPERSKDGRRSYWQSEWKDRRKPSEEFGPQLLSSSENLTKQKETDTPPRELRPLKSYFSNRIETQSFFYPHPKTFSHCF